SCLRREGAVHGRDAQADRGAQARLRPRSRRRRESSHDRGSAMTAAPADDRDFLDAFESGALPEGAFRHRDHVRLAWLYLRRLPPAAALARFSDGLRRFAASLGKSGLYHETITWAFLLLIRERMERGGEERWTEFARRNPDLLSWKPSI